MERQNFEKEFKDAFDGAEGSPSGNAWVNIELELERAEGKKMRRRVFYYQMLAAASITFALIVAGAGALIYQRTDGFNQISQSPTDGGLPQTSGTAQTPDSNEAAEGDTSLARAGTKPYNQSEPVTSNEEGSVGEPHKKEPGLPDQNHTKKYDSDLVAEANSTDRVDRIAPATGESATDENSRHAGKKSNSVDQITLKADSRENLASQQTIASASQSDSADNNDRKERNVVDGMNPPVSETVPSALKTSSLRNDDPSLAGRRAANDPAETGIPGSSEQTGSEKQPDGMIVAGKASETPDALPAEKKEDTFSSEADPVVVMMEKLKDLEKELATQGTGKKKKNNTESSREQFWTSLGFAAGTFNGESSGTMSPANSLAMTSSLDNQAKAAGTAYSVNISVGKRISEKVVIQGGLSYLNNSTSYTSSQVVLADNNSFKPATFNDVRAAEASFYNNSRIIPTAPHSVNNNIEFISVPVQAGYLIIDRKIGFQFNAGVSTDFFIQNTIDPQGVDPSGADIRKTTQERGAESPYRSTNFSGLMSTELTYRLGDSYRLSLNPGIRYPFNSIYKEETGIDSTPLTFDVGLRFRYIFR